MFKMTIPSTEAVLLRFPVPPIGRLNWERNRLKYK